MKFLFKQCLFHSLAIFNYRINVLWPALIFIAILFARIEICAGQSKELPNIIVIIPDDMGWGDIGYNGSGIKTPNLDRLAETGIKLNYQYVMSTCTPTRIGIFTGRYASRFGVTSPAYGKLIPPGTPTMASLLRKKGYFTALVGKWHMGSPPYIPVKYGFQTAYGYLDGQIDPYTHHYKKGYAHYNEETKTSYVTSKSWNGEGEYLLQKHPYLKQNLKEETKEENEDKKFPHFKFLEQKGHVTDLLTDQAIHIIKEKRKNPFFLYLAYSVPHYPLEEPAKWLSLYKHVFTFASRRIFAASLTHLDACIGRIIKTLNETKQRKNTLILFISDNGAQKDWPEEERKVLYKGRYANTPYPVLGSNYPLRGWKGSLYEGAIRVPAFVNWPGHLKPETIHVPVNWTDWLPTFLGLTGSNKSELQKLHFDGEDIWPLLLGTEKKNDFENRSFFWETPGAYAVREGAWKLIEDKKDGKIELYNVQSDFREFNEVSKAYPKEVEQLKILLMKNIQEERQE